MLNLLKLPFQGRQSSFGPDHLSSDFTVAIVANYRRHCKNLNGEELDKAYNLAIREMELLRREFGADPVGNYELMAATLRRIDEALRG